MSPAEWQRVKYIFQEAIERPLAERPAFLDEACGGDFAVRAEVESLLDFHGPAQKFIDEPAVAAAATVFAEGGRGIEAGQRIGSYRVSAEAGRGGMGAVYVAERVDGLFEQTVAIKVLKRGMDTDAILRRFAMERQILASLDHPNIARLLDGGTTDDGQPFFVLEYVKGIPLDRYCDERSASVSERLKTFLQICSAVSYAHQNLVVHRDLKPSNILVADDGTPKLLDFGIARLLGEQGTDATTTEVGTRALTPRYASPEQLQGLPVTTLSDVYSLGVVLYELLTGHRPYRIKRTHSGGSVHITRDREPERPSAIVTRAEESEDEDGVTARTVRDEAGRTREENSTQLRRRLRGDLDNIILRALREDPHERYGSVAELAEDIRRHLAGLPVRAHKDSLAYRARKFVRRNRVGVAAAAAMLLLLLSGVAATLWQAREAQRERALAERRFRDVRKLANSVVFKYHDAAQKLPGSTPLREMMAKDALEYLDRLAQEAGADRELQAELAEAYVKVGDVQGLVYNANIGDTQGALASYLKAAGLCEALIEANPDDTKSRGLLSTSYLRASMLLRRSARWREAHEFAMRNVRECELLTALEPSKLEHRRGLARAYIFAGFTAEHTDGYAEEVAFIHRALPILEDLYRMNPSSYDVRRDLSIGLQRLGTTLVYWGEARHEQGVENDELTRLYRESEAYHRRALEVGETVLTEEGPTPRNLRFTAVNAENTGWSLTHMGEHAAALPLLRRAYDMFRQVAADDPQNREAQNDLADALEALAQGQVGVGGLQEAENSYRESLALLGPLLQHDPTNAEFREHTLRVCLLAGDMLLEHGRMRGARSYFERALVVAQEAPEGWQQAAGLVAIADAQGRLGKYHAAVAAHPDTRPHERSEHWRRAREHYRHAHTNALLARERGTLSATGNYKPELFDTRLEECETALKGL